MFLQITASNEQLRDLKLDSVKGGLMRRKNFLEKTNDGKERWGDFVAILEEAEKILDS